MAPLPRPVEVRHEGRWLAGSLLAARRGGDGAWRGLVQYTATVPVAHLGSSRLLGLDAEGSAPLAFYGWRGQHDLRPLSPQLAAPTA